MLAGPKLQSLNELVKDASHDELLWISGYISALTHQPAVVPSVAPAVKEFVQDASFAIPACTIVYGTESGNSKKLAVDFSGRLKKQGVQAKMKNLEQYKPADLSKESCLMVIMSTQGDGEPPEGAKKFYDYIFDNQLSLSHLKFGVLALGDSAYPLFCKAGEDVDNRLYHFGARRILPLKKCDTDFEGDASAWMDDIIKATISFGNASAASETVSKSKTAKKVYDGTVTTIINLNDTGSAKETYHIEITSEDAFVYEPGDAIAIVAKNHRTIVDKVFQLLGLSPDAQFTYKGVMYNANELFTSRIGINYLPERIVEKYSKLIKKNIPAAKMDLADLLQIYPADVPVNAQELVSILENITPRLYSVSSSPASNGENEVHITVSRSNFEIGGVCKNGLCSDYLSGLREGDSIQFYVQKNNNFRLPASNADVIMIGPGTGIAPFRSFLFEREAKGDEGRNWLFFGDQHFVTDFLYQTDLLQLFDTGVLTKLNTAFSRDQQEKIYVQHRMQQHAAELFSWIENGAHLYVCGNKDPMSIDVENTLINIVRQQKNTSEEAAKEFISMLKEEGRYHKDVY